MSAFDELDPKQIEELRRPFTPEAIKWKVQATGPKGKPSTWGMVVPYIDARLVIERLDEVAPGEWGDRTEPCGTSQVA